MRAYHVSLGAGIDGLALREDPVPEPGPRQVLVRVRASSLSFRELMILRGWYPLPVRPDVIPVSDGAGEVVATGPGVSRATAGDRVMAAMFPRWLAGRWSPDLAPQLGGSLDGMLAEYALLDEDALVPVPPHLSFEQAACLPCAGVTAWNALTGGRGLVAGETVVTLGTGGVSLFAVRFAKAAGAHVIATTGSVDKAGLLRALGADAVIDYREVPDWAGRVADLTGGRGADHVIETAGNLGLSVRALAVEGEIAFVGLLGAGAGLPAIEARELLTKGLTIRAIAVGSRAHFEAMCRAICASRLEPVIDRIFPLADAPAAYRYYEREQPFGKVVISHD